MADFTRRALDMKVEQALGRVHEAAVKFDETMVRVTELQLRLRELGERIEAEQSRLGALLAEADSEVEQPSSFFSFRDFVPERCG